MSGAMFDVSEVVALAADLGKVPGSVIPELVTAAETVSEALRAAWSANASATSGRSGYEYPGSITAEMKISLGSIGAEIGPESGIGQGGLGRGFEYGSVHQPPHLDGQKAADATAPHWGEAVTAAAVKGFHL